MSIYADARTPTRRMGVEGSETREQLIDVAEQIIAAEGCSAVTARRLSEQLGLKRQIVHYYFRSIEDLLIAVIRRQGHRLKTRLSSEMELDANPEALWKPGSEFPAAVFEFMALATRREAIRSEVSRYLAEFRKMRAEAIARWMERQGIESAVPPMAIATILMAMSQTLALEGAIDVSLGHAETRSYIEAWLRDIQSGAV